MRKPTSDEWNEWAMLANMPGELISFAKQFPAIFASFDDPQAENNDYIHDPRRPERTAFVTPRSLERSAWMLDHRQNMTADQLIAGLSGIVGQAAARDLVTHLSIADKLPPLESVFVDPVKAKLPDSSVGQLILGINLLRIADESNVTAILTYVERMVEDVAAVLAQAMIGKSNHNVLLFCTKPKFLDLTKKLRILFQPEA